MQEELERLAGEQRDQRSHAANLATAPRPPTQLLTNNSIFQCIKRSALIGELKATLHSLRAPGIDNISRATPSIPLKHVTCPPQARRQPQPPGEP